MSLAPVKAVAPPKAILFDLDDTLWPIAPVIAAAEILLHDWLATHAPKVAQQFSSEMLRQHRLTMLNEQPHFHGNLIELRRAGLLSAFEAAGEDPALVDGAIVHFLAARNRVRPYDDVLPGLAWLRQRMLVGSISNGNADLEIIGLAQHFKVSIAASD
ncbi:MAG: HAD family hydrolase, partial [Janthinobacterium sp.]